MSEYSNIFVKPKYINIHKNSGWLKYLSGVRRCFELYIGETEEDAKFYMASTLLNEKTLKSKRMIEAVMHDGNKYYISTQYTPGKTFWKDTSTRTGCINHNEIEIAKIDFDGFCNKHWQTNIFLNSGEEFNIFPYLGKSSFWSLHQMIYGTKETVRITGNATLLMEIDEPRRYHIRRPTKAGWIKTDGIRPELLLALPVYYYVLYPDYIEDRTVDS